MITTELKDPLKFVTTKGVTELFLDTVPLELMVPLVMVPLVLKVPFIPAVPLIPTVPLVLLVTIGITTAPAVGTIKLVDVKVYACVPTRDTFACDSKVIWVTSRGTMLFTASEKMRVRSPELTLRVK